jgi:hypothetical protein
LLWPALRCSHHKLIKRWHENGPIGFGLDSAVKASICLGSNSSSPLV